MLNPKVALYWHNGRSLGHTARSTLIGKHLLLQKPKSNVVGITGAIKGLYMLPDGMDLFKIPTMLTFENPVKTVGMPLINLPKTDILSMRKDLVTRFLETFQPDALVVDYFPFGKQEELVDAINQGFCQKLIWGLRGILDSPSVTNSEFFSESTVEFVVEHYDKILVYTDPEVIRIEEYYEIPTDLSRMFTYTGYIARNCDFSKAAARDQLRIALDSGCIVCSFGGGQGMGDTISQVIACLKLVHDIFDYAYVITGPYLENAWWQRLEMECHETRNIKIIREVPDLLPWYKASDLFISNGGYNTVLEVINNRINSIVIPRSLQEREQELLTSRFASRGLIRKVSIEHDLGEQLVKMIPEALTNPFPASKHSIHVDGARMSAEVIFQTVEGQAL